MRTEKEETRWFSHLRPRFPFQDSFTSMVGHNEDLLAQKDVSRPVLGLLVSGLALTLTSMRQLGPRGV